MTQGARHPRSMVNIRFRKYGAKRNIEQTHTSMCVELWVQSDVGRIRLQRTKRLLQRVQWSFKKDSGPRNKRVNKFTATLEWGYSALKCRSIQTAGRERE